MEVGEATAKVKPTERELQLLQINFLDDIVVRSLPALVVDEFKGSDIKLLTARLAPACAGPCAARRRFLEAVHYCSDPSDFVVVFHGTPAANVEAIAAGGLNPLYRVCPADYFGKSPDTAYPYSRGGGLMLAFLVVRDFAVGIDGRHGVYLETDDVIALANNDLSLPLMILEVSRLEPLLSGPSLNEGEKLNEESDKLLAERDHFAYLYDMEKEQNGTKLKRLELKVLRQGRRLQKADGELKAVYAQLNALAPLDPDSQADLFGDGAGATVEQLLVQLHAERDAGAKERRRLEAIIQMYKSWCYHLPPPEPRIYSSSDEEGTWGPAL